MSEKNKNTKEKPFTLDREVLVEKNFFKIRIKTPNVDLRTKSMWWYQDDPKRVEGHTYVVRSCSSREELTGLCGLGKTKISELYIVVKKINDDGTEDEDSDDINSAVLKKHCKSVKFR